MSSTAPARQRVSPAKLERAPGVSKSLLALLSMAALGIGAGQASPIASTLPICVGLALAAWATFGSSPLTNGLELRWSAVVAMLTLVGALGPSIASYPGSMSGARPLLIVIGAAACVASIVGGGSRRGRMVAAGLAATVALLSIAAVARAEWNSDLGTDIYRAHRAAGTALLEGENPYTDAVRFADGNPFHDDRIVEGYPYPPVALGAYGLAGGLTDPRLVSAVAWLAMIAWMTWVVAARRSDESSSVALAALLLSTLSPLGAFVWFMAWTEPLTLILFAAAALSWRRSPNSSGVWLGLALASKQYLVFLLPLVLLNRSDGWKRRSTVALVTAVGTLLLGLITDPDAFVRSTLGNLLAIGFRPDTQSISGLLHAWGIAFSLPSAIWLAVSLVGAVLIGRTSTSRARFFLQAALCLGFAFLVGMGFPNYWFLVAGLILIGTILRVDDDAGAARVAGIA